MKLTRRQIYMAGGLGIALVALVVDRVVGPSSGPSHAIAASPTAQDAAERVVGQLSGLALLPAATPENEARADVPDVFDTTRLKIELAPPPEVAQPTKDALSSAGSFCSRFSINGVMLSKRPAVLIGRHLLHVGDRLGEFTLESISADGAVFISPDGDRAILPAPKRDRAAGQPEL